MKRLYIFTITICFVIVAFTQTTAAQEINKKTLDNGLTILVQEDHTFPVVSVQVFVKTGSVYEGKYLGCGISHVTEHLVSGGATPNRTEEQSSQLLDKLGGQSNAYTWKDKTVYFINTSSINTAAAIELISDWMLHCTIPQESYDRELQVINRELERGRDNEMRVLSEREMKNLFRIHPVRIPVIGYKDMLNTLTRDDVYAYYKERYIPSNMVVIVAGDVTSEEVFAEVEKNFKNAPMKVAPKIVLPSEPPQVSQRMDEFTFPTSFTRMTLDYRTVPVTNEDMYPLDIISYVLTEGESSRLEQLLKYDKQLVLGVSSYSSTPSFDAGSFSINAVLQYTNLDKVKELIFEELEKIKTNSITNEELAVAKKQKIADYVFSHESADEIASAIGWDMLSVGDPTFSRQYTDNIQKVTKEDISRVAKKYFTAEALCLTIMKPETVSAKPKEQTASTTQETAAANQIQKTVLSNGITLLTLHNSTTPSVSICAFFNGGVRFEKEENAGIFNFMASLLTKGTTTLNQREFAKKIDSMGAQISSRGGNFTFYLTSRFLKDDFDEGYSLFADCIKNPAFDPQAIELTRSLLLSGIKRQKDDPYTEAELFFDKHMFPESPYRFPVAGTEQSIQAITRNDLVSLFSQYGAANNMVIAIFGDVDVEQAKAKTYELFGDLPRNDSLAIQPVTGAVALSQSEKFIQQTDKENAIVYMGYPGLSMVNLQDRFPMAVLDAIASGVNAPGGLLHKELRGRGLVYEVHAFNMMMPAEAGYFGIYAVCQGEQVDEVVKVILDNIKKLKAGEFSDEDFAIAKGVCITANDMQLQTNQQLAMQASLNELYGLGFDFHINYAYNINNVTKDDVTKVANKYLKQYLLTVSQPSESQ